MFDDDYEDRMHDIRQDERQEKPMSDAAQKAVIRVLGEYTHVTDEQAQEFAAHVLAVLSETHAVVELPEGRLFETSGEREWEFGAQWSEGYVNREASSGGGVTFDLARDTPEATEMGGYPTCAEGFVPDELIEQFAAALLAGLKHVAGDPQ